MLWNVPVNDEESAKKALEKVITDGIGLNLDFEYSVVDINRERKLIKLESAKNPNSYIDNTRRLIKKSVLKYSDIFVTDDAPQSVREVRRKLFTVRLSEVNRDDVRVTKSILPLLCMRQSANTEPVKLTK